MIAQLTGTVARAAAGLLVLNVNGVGYRVSVPVSVLETLPPENTPLTLQIHTLVREDDLALFGFADETDLQVFELLISVSGVGPKAALALLSTLTAADLAHAVADEDVRTLTRVPGIGAKIAQRLALELKDKMAALGFAQRIGQMAGGGGSGGRGAAAARKPATVVMDDVISALMNLGYNKPEATRAADAARQEREEKGELIDAGAFALLLRAALNRLTK